MIARGREWLRRHGANEILTLLIAGVACIAVWVFIEIADEVIEGEHEQVEKSIIRAFREPADPAELRGPAWLDEIVRDITALGSTVVLTLVTVLVTGHLLVSGRRRHAALIVIATIGGVLLSTALKLVFARDRPDVVPHLATIFDPSFPSGHTLLSSVVYLTLGALLAQAAQRRRERYFFINAALLLCFLVGLSRVALGVHYPSDVVAGWALGVTWATLCWSAAWWLTARRRNRPRPSDASAEDGES